MRLRPWCWLMEALLLVCCRSAWVTAQPWSLGQPEFRLPASLSSKGSTGPRGRSASLALGWEGTCSYEDGRPSLPGAWSSELKTWAPFQTRANCVFHLTHMWVGRKGVLERNQSCQQYVHWIWENWVKCASLFPTSASDSAHRHAQDEVKSVSSSLFHQLSCPRWLLPSWLTSPVCWGCCCSTLISHGCDGAWREFPALCPHWWLKSGWTVGTGWREAPCKNAEDSSGSGFCSFLSKVACPGHVARSCHYSHYVNIPSTRWRFFYVFVRA